MDAPRADEFGIIPSTIAYQLREIPDDVPEGRYDRLPVPDAKERLMADRLGRRFVQTQYVYDGHEHFEWESHWRTVPIDILRRVFTVDELLQIHYSCIVATPVGEWLEKEHFLVWKVQNSLWHYGWSTSYNAICATLSQLPRLGFPGLESRLVHTRSYNEFGLSEQIRSLYLDGTMGLVALHRGKHVLTVGFSPGIPGVYVAQVQLRHKRGNRFLFSLQDHYLDLALDGLHGAFGDRLWLVTGDSAVAATRRSYGKLPCLMTPDDEARMRSLYDRPLARFRRTGDSETRQGRTFVRLARRA